MTMNNFRYCDWLLYYSVFYLYINTIRSGYYNGLSVNYSFIYIEYKTVKLTEIMILFYS